MRLATIVAKLPFTPTAAWSLIFMPPEPIVAVEATGNPPMLVAPASAVLDGGEGGV